MGRRGKGQALAESDQTIDVIVAEILYAPRKDIGMFDPVASFSKQFTPVDGGYLIYPSRKSGGKLVTHDEYDRLFADWKRIAGTRGIWIAAAVVVLVISAWTVALDLLSLPEWTDTVFMNALIVMVVGRFVWAGFAPHRLVRGRPAIAPPRQASAARREARAAINWPVIVSASLICGAAFLNAVQETNRTWDVWIWLIGSGALLIVYLWIAVQKLLDRHRS